ncbi:hypothetical protein [Paenibacillus mucilaginosus]|uniref:glycoside hydrolase family 78 protein n=1 Tax=Paenibacillus mucilaginosus TaxID=61624 RepID=UPI003D197356
MIDYITSDNSKLVIDNAVYDNNTGAKLDAVVPGTAYGSLSYKIRGYIGDKVLYADDSTGYLVLYSLDLNTMARNSVVLSPVSTSDGVYYMGDAANQLEVTVTSDRKLMMAFVDESRKLKLRIYDEDLNLVREIENTTKAAGSAGRPYILADGSVTVPVRTQYDSSDNFYAWIITADVVSTDANQFNHGQFYNYSETLTDGELFAKFKLNYDSYSDITSYGLSARMQDNRNMYRLEVSNRKSKLVKIVNGTRTVLQEVSYPIRFGAYIDVKLKVNGTRLKGYVNGVPLLDVNDTTFTAAGTYGPYSETPYVFMKNFTSTVYVGNTNLTHNTAIVGQPIEYVTSYSDLENDPAIADLTKWTFDHVEPNKFLDAGDGYSGLSSLHGQTVTSPAATIDKVGRYKIDYTLPDDPAPEGFKYPSPVFENYRKYSDVVTQYVIIHRRPIAMFTLTANTDNTVSWNDTSYDPDRFLSETNYSTEAAGIDYNATRGILERKRNYTTPSGTLVHGQLTRPAETGTYTVREAVKDEYGAWSDWYEVSIYLIGVPNSPPTVNLTFPNGSQANPTFVDLRPTIAWNQADLDPNTIFSIYDLNIKDEAGNCVRCLTNRPMDTQNGSWTWPMDTDLQMGKKYQVQVRVSDGTAWSQWSNVGWMQTNRPPSVVMTYPSGTQDNPTISNTLRPTLTWNQTDPDPGAQFDYFQIQITNEANDTFILDSGKTWQGTTSNTGSWTVTQDLPTGVKMRVRVMVWDQYGAASEWSAQTWLFINRAPIADFTWTPNPAWEGDTITLRNASTDPDGDAMTYTWVISGPNGYSSTQTTTDATIGADITNYRPGDYTVTLTARDVHGATGSVTKIVTVNQLTLDFSIQHTQQWIDYYNENLLDLGLFMAGEPFMVNATTSPTATSTSVHFAFPWASIEVSKAFLYDRNDDPFPNFAHTAFLGSMDSTNWTGKAWRKYWIQIPDGTYTVTAETRYSNGQVRTRNLSVVIQDHIWYNKKEADTDRG